MRLAGPVFKDEVRNECSSQVVGRIRFLVAIAASCAARQMGATTPSRLSSSARLWTLK
jgi:hypothetical protein